MWLIVSCVAELLLMFRQLYEMSDAAMNTRLEVADSQFHEAVLAGIVQVLGLPSTAMHF